MSTHIETVTVVRDPNGLEAWCDECGSVAYSSDEWHAQEIVAGAARLHIENDHAYIWLNAEGQPTIKNTGRTAGGARPPTAYSNGTLILVAGMPLPRR